MDPWLQNLPKPSIEALLGKNLRNHKKEAFEINLNGLYESCALFRESIEKYWNFIPRDFDPILRVKVTILLKILVWSYITKCVHKWSFKSLKGRNKENYESEF